MDNKREEACLLQKMSEHNEVLSACVVRMDAMLSRLRGAKCADPHVGEVPPLGAASGLIASAEGLHIELARRIDELNTLL